MIKNGMRPIHPGEFIREDYLVPLNMSVHALAKALDVPATRLHEIVKERRAITADTALRLGRFFDTTPDYWLTLQHKYDLKLAEREAGANIAKRVQPMQGKAA